jgi:hypothetical protein
VPDSVVISSPREPVAVTVLSAFLLFCVVATFAYDRVATNSLRAFGDIGGRVFLLLLALGCTLYLLAAWVDTPRAVLRFERPAWLLLTAVFAIYSTWSVVLSGARATGFFLVLFALVVAAQWRLWRIREFRRAIKATPVVES